MRPWWIFSLATATLMVEREIWKAREKGNRRERVWREEERRRRKGESKEENGGEGEGEGYSYEGREKEAERKM